ncbi:MAG: inorganic diphosphatase [Candidatus Paceibacteria bacterium]
MENFWHDVSIGDQAPKKINSIVEIPRGSSNKYELDKETGMIMLDRANYTSSPYPFDYAMIPQTLWDDGDALDAVIFSTYPIDPGVLVKLRPVGVMEMTDSGESDFKILGVPENDRRWDDVQDLEDLNDHKLKEYAHFFETYKELKQGEGNEVTVHGYKGKEDALEAIDRSIDLYQEKFE